MTPLLVSLTVAVVIGLLLRLRDGSFRTPGRSAALAGPAGLPAPVVLGAHATLLQISAEACAVCPRVATTLAGVARAEPGVTHVELRAEDHPDLLERYDVRRSPTVLVLDASGRLRSRASGAVTADQARAALATLLPVEDPR